MNLPISTKLPADYEYNSENYQIVDFHSETIKNHKNHGRLRLFQPICKISQNVPNITCRPHRDTHFLLHLFILQLLVVEKIRDTFDIEFKYPYSLLNECFYTFQCIQFESFHYKKHFP